MKRIKWIFSKACNNYEWYVFRKSFEYKNEEEVMIDITALGRFVLYVNGQYVCRGPVRSYDFEKIYDRVEISPYLKSGKNTVPYFPRSSFQVVFMSVLPTMVILCAVATIRGK